MQLTSSRNVLIEQNCNRERKLHLLIFSLCFLAGGLLGSIAGCGSPWLLSLADGYLNQNINNFSIVLAILWCVRFQLLAFILGTSYLGTFFIPLLLVLRSFLLSCGSSTIIAAYPQNGIIMTLVLVALPALISIPCFWVISSEAFSSSLSLVRLASGNFIKSNINRFKYFLICLPFMALSVIAEIRIVPYLVSLITK